MHPIDKLYRTYEIVGFGQAEQQVDNICIDIPVTISGFIIGTFVTVISVFLYILFLPLKIPTAAAVPNNVAKIDETTARIKVFFKALIEDEL